MLDAFIILRNYAIIPDTTQELNVSSSAGTARAAENEDTGNTAPVTTTNIPYSDGETNIELKQCRQDDTTVYVVDIMLPDTSVLKMALTSNTYGKDVTQTTSDMAAGTDVVLTINEDYYSTRSDYMIRNGILYRDAFSDVSQEDLMIYRGGSFEIMAGGFAMAAQLLESGVQQMLSFGPALVKDGEASVTQGEEVGRAMPSNPYTAIDQIDGLHYVMVVASSRTKESVGLSLYQMAEFIRSPGVKTAYNLDGGNSTTTVLDDKVINQPTTDGSRISERKVSNIVYIG